MEIHFEKNLYNLHRDYCFLDIFLAGYLFNINSSTSPQNNPIDRNKISVFSTGDATRFPNTKKQFAKK